MDFQYKLFRRYSVLLIFLLFYGCASSSFFYPWQQIEYSNNNQVKIFKNEMNKNSAISILRTHIKDDPIKLMHIADKNIEYTLKIYNPDAMKNIDDISHKVTMKIPTETTQERNFWAQRICFRSRKNIVIDEEKIAYDDVTECWAFLRSFENYNIYEFDGDEEIKSTLLTYSDVSKIKLFECTEIHVSFIYEVALYNKADNVFFYFTTSRDKSQMAQAQRLVAALSFLMPHAKEEYNDKRFMLPPRYGGRPSSN